MPYCAYCGHEISESAASCPNCGHPVDAPVGPPPSTTTGELAGFWIRFLSLIIDSLLVGLVTLPFGVARRTSGNYVFYLNPTRNIVQFVYVWLMVALVNGQTLGMMVTGLRAARPDGSAVDLGRSAARAAMGYVSGLALGLGYLWAAWDPEKRTWHDMVADTRVYRVRAGIQRT